MEKLLQQEKENTNKLVCNKIKREHENIINIEKKMSVIGVAVIFLEIW